MSARWQVFGDVSERSVHDLWPLGVMRRRAGASGPTVNVYRPATYQQVANLLRFAAHEGFKVVPLGGGSGVCGAVEPRQDEVVLDLGALDRILAIEETDLSVQAQAGVNGMKLEEELNRQGLTLGHYPSSLQVTTVGGLVSTRSSGQESSHYGHIEDMVLGLTVVLADGSIIEPRPGPRSAAGPALHELLLGAEGGLGVVLDAVLRVHRRPELVLGGGFAFGDVSAGLDAMRAVVQDGLRPLVIRLYDPEDTALQGVDADGCLMVAASAGRRTVVEAGWALTEAAMAAHGARQLGESAWAHWRDHRFSLSAERLLDFLRPPGAYLDTIEVASPWSRLPAVYQAIKAALAANAQLALCHFAHPEEQGCCAYFTFGGSAADEHQAEAAYGAAWSAAMEAALAGGATISHHHGVGQARAAWIQREMGGWWGVWESIRKALDPGGILNPNALGGRTPRA
jgi:alkyldihydroxyacetonephosphate synthase